MALLLAGSTCLATAPVPVGVSQTSDAPRPNILVCIADDMSWAHTSVGGDLAVRTPNFDRVAKAGVRFENAYCSSPSCAPS